MPEDNAEAREPGNSPQPETGAPQDSPPANPTGAKADSPPARGAKQPKSLSDALDAAKLETVTEEAETEQADSQPAESPPPEPEAEPDSEAEGTQDEPSSENEPDATAEPSSFDKRREWQDLEAALGKDGAKKARPILRKLMEAETHAKARAEAMRPMADIASEFKQLAGDDAGWQNMQRIIRDYVQNPAEAVPILESMLRDARQRGGLEVTSADLKERLAEIDQQVQDGLMDAQFASKQRALVLEAEKARASTRRADGELKQTREQSQRQQTAAAEQRTAQTLNAWENSVRTRVPDFGDVTAPDDPNHGRTVADQVFDALCLKRMQSPQATAQDLVKEADRVLKLALARVGAPAPRQQRVVTSQGSSATAKPRPRTLREAMDSVRLQ